MLNADFTMNEEYWIRKCIQERESAYAECRFYNE